MARKEAVVGIWWRNKGSRKFSTRSRLAPSTLKSPFRTTLRTDFSTIRERPRRSRRIFTKIGCYDQKSCRQPGEGERRNERAIGAWRPATPSAGPPVTLLRDPNMLCAQSQQFLGCMHEFCLTFVCDWHSLKNLTFLGQIYRSARFIRLEVHSYRW